MVVILWGVGGETQRRDAFVITRNIAAASLRVKRFGGANRVLTGNDIRQIFAASKRQTLQEITHLRERQPLQQSKAVMPAQPRPRRRRTTDSAQKPRHLPRRF